MKSDYLVCYDITSPRRLSRIYRFMKGRGLHLQYSVFHCALTWPELEGLKDRLADMINPDEDDIRIYPLPSGGKVAVLGLAKKMPDGVEIFMK